MNTTWLTLIKEDISVWSEHYKLDKHRFTTLFFRYPEFRSILKMRIKLGEQENRSFILKMLRITVAISCKYHNCFIYTEPNKIGGGLILHHGFATMIAANHIGRQLHVYQQVTIGGG